MGDKAVITCALNGVLTDPKQHHVPVTPEQMAREAKAAFEAGASVMHIHLRQQAEGKGHLPSWEVSVSREIQQAIREACPGVVINHTTGTSGPNYRGALDCVRETRPELAAASALRRTRRPSAHRTGRYVLSARRQQGNLERTIDRDPGKLCAPSRPRNRQPRGGSADLWD